MSDKRDPTTPEARRQRDLERAIETLRREQAGRIFGVVSFHLQSGRIVRVEVKTTESFS